LYVYDLFCFVGSLLVVVLACFSPGFCVVFLWGCSLCGYVGVNFGLLFCGYLVDAMFGVMYWVLFCIALLGVMLVVLCWWCIWGG